MFGETQRSPEESGPEQNLPPEGIPVPVSPKAEGAQVAPEAEVKFNSEAEIEADYVRRMAGFDALVKDVFGSEERIKGLTKLRREKGLADNDAENNLGYQYNLANARVKQSSERVNPNVKQQFSVEERRALDFDKKMAEIREDRKKAKDALALKKQKDQTSKGPDTKIDDKLSGI